MAFGIPNIAQAGVALVPTVDSSFGRRLESALANPMKTAGKAAAGGLTAIATAATAVGAASVSAFLPFEESLAKIVGLVGVNREQVDAWKSDIKDIAKETAQGPQDLADALFFITSAGLEGADAIETLEASARAATAGLGDTSQIADVLTSALNAYGSENLSAAAATDILVATVREGKAEADALAGSLGRVIPIAAQMDIGFDEVGAAVAALTQTGLSADEAVTALRSTFTTILDPTNEAQEALAAMGLSASELRAQAASDLPTLLLTLADAFNQNEEAATTLFPNVRALTGVLSLTGSNAENVQGIFRNLSEATGSLDRAFGAVAETSGFTFRQFMSEIQTILLDVGEDILPQITEAFRDLAPRLGDLVEGLGDIAVAAVNFGTSVIAGFGNFRREVERTLIQVQQFADFGGSLGLGLFTDNDTDRARRFADILDATLDRVAEGAEPAETLRTALINLGATDIASLDNIERLREELGLTNREVLTLLDSIAAGTPATDRAADAQRRLADAAAFYRQEVTGADRLQLFENYRENTAKIAQYTEATRDAGDATADLGDDFEDVINQAHDATDAFEDYEDRTYGLADALDEAAEGQRNLWQEMRASADPIFRAVRELDSFRDVLERIDEDGERTNEELLELASSTLDLRAAMAEVRADGNLTEGIDAIAEALGFTRDEVVLLLEQLGLLDATEVAVLVKVQYRAENIGSQGFLEGDVPDVAIRVGSNVGFQQGGLTKDRFGVVHPGELVFPPPDTNPTVYRAFAEALVTELPEGLGAEREMTVVVPIRTTVEVDRRVLGEVATEAVARELSARFQ